MDTLAFFIDFYFIRMIRSKKEGLSVDSFRRQVPSFRFFAFQLRL